MQMKKVMKIYGARNSKWAASFLFSLTTQLEIYCDADPFRLETEAEATSFPL